MESTTKKSQRRGNFSLEEDNLLVSSWLATSMDAIHGINQKASTFWGRVHAHYDEYKKPTFITRSVNSITNRWSTIQVATNKFCACLCQIERKPSSGLTEQDKIEQAKLLYHNNHGVTFNFEHCWNTLKCHPKWKQNVAEGNKKSKRKSLSQEPSAPPESIHLGEDNVSQSAFVDLERPIGKKAQKEREKTRRRQDHMSSNLAEVVSEIKEDKKKSHEQRMEERQEFIRLTKERLEMELEMEQSREEREHEANRVNKNRLEVERSREDREIMSMDTSNMSPMRKEYFRSRQMEIIEKRRVMRT
ncbi:hypothetical protein SLA2020_437730 [Shorea laevis]